MVVDGWLIFDGERTRFALKRSDVRTRLGPQDRNSPDYILEGIGTSFKVSLYDLRRAKGASVRSVRMVGRTWEEPRASVWGASVLPPMKADPDRVQELSIDLTSGALLATSGVAGLLWVLLWLNPRVPDSGETAVYMAVVLSGGFAVIGAALCLTYPFAKARLKRLL